MSKLNKTTNNHLVLELIKLNKEGKYDNIIKRAKNNDYHDFKSDIACPKMELVKDLSKFPELEDIRQFVIAGVYDEQGNQKD